MYTGKAKAEIWQKTHKPRALPSRNKNGILCS